MYIRVLRCGFNIHTHAAHTFTDAASMYIYIKDMCVQTGWFNIHARCSYIYRCHKYIYIYIRHVCTDWYGQSDSCHQSDSGICMLYMYICMCICMFTIHTHAAYTLTHAKKKLCIKDIRVQVGTGNLIRAINLILAYVCYIYMLIYISINTSIYTHTRTHMCTRSWCRR